MNFRRGDLVWVAVKGPYTGKPRPAVVVQATADSDVMADKIVTVPKDAIESPAFGRLSPREVARLNGALRFWLGL
jgi:mRNA-degrading endonuclease toxin of MazEF toxin-antitoxin module